MAISYANTNEFIKSAREALQELGNNRAPADVNPESRKAGADINLNGSSNSDYGNLDENPPNNPYGGGGYGYGYGYGYGSGNSGPTKNQVEMAKNLAPLSKFGQDIILGKAKNAGDVYDVADQDALNNRNYQAIVAKTKAADEWHPLETALQRAHHQLRVKMGNAAYGSTVLDHLQDVEYQSNKDAKEVQDALRESEMDINNEFYDALARTINGRNELAMDTEDKLNQGHLDYLTQLLNIHPDLVNGNYEGTEENGDAGESWPKRINAESGKISFPDWMVTDYYNANKKSPVNRWQAIKLITPDRAGDKAAGLVYGKGAGKNGPSTRESSVNQKYWDRLTRTYAAREV